MSPIVKAFFVTVAVAALNRWLEPIADQHKYYFVLAGEEFVLSFEAF